MKENIPPPVLYKYCRGERDDILHGCSVRFTQGSELNDIFEMRPLIAFDVDAYAAGRRAVAERYPGVLEVPAVTAEEHHRLVDETLQEVLVLSLSSAWDIVPMWSYYAECHRGFAIGFDSSSELFCQESLAPVVYSAEYPTSGDEFQQAIFTKYHQWKHECEWRSFKVPSAQSPDSILEVGEKAIYLYKFNPRAVREIILGHRIEPAIRQAIVNRLSDTAYRHVRLFQAKPDDKSWKLLRSEISREL